MSSTSPTIWRAAARHCTRSSTMWNGLRISYCQLFPSDGREVLLPSSWIKDTQTPTCHSREGGNPVNADRLAEVRLRSGPSFNLDRQCLLDPRLRGDDRRACVTWLRAALRRESSDLMSHGPACRLDNHVSHHLQ